LTENVVENPQNTLQTISKYFFSRGSMHPHPHRILSHSQVHLSLDSYAVTSTHKILNVHMYMLCEFSIIWNYSIAWYIEKD